MTVCDVCSMAMDFADGYALTTTEVITNENYWQFMLDNHTFSDDQILLMYIQQQAMQRSGWLVCKSCSYMFTFNRAKSKKCAMKQKDPRGSGPADVNSVAAAAAKAWKNKHGDLPSWLK